MSNIFDQDESQKYLKEIFIMGKNTIFIVFVILKCGIVNIYFTKYCINVNIFIIQKYPMFEVADTFQISSQNFCW